MVVVLYELNLAVDIWCFGLFQDTYTPIVPEEVDGGVVFKEADRRPSAKAVGTVGIVFMAATAGLLLVCDILNVKPKHGGPKPRGRGRVF